MNKGTIAGILLLVAVLGWRLFEYWSEIDANGDRGTTHEVSVVTPGYDARTLAGMPPATASTLEGSLAKAQSSGPAALREWIKACRPMVNDPRMAWIELDYVVMVARENPAEAKKVFAEIKTRIAPTSPIYPRIKQLEKTYQ
ncbi:MAG: hypothetical protein RLZZ350_2282 [Verrucomicrobiota bacterium]|jgi:hypothetical protein